MKVFDLSEFQPDDRVYTLAEEHDADGVILKLGETLSGTPTLDPKFETFVNDAIENNYTFGNDNEEMYEKYSMSDTMDQQLLNSIEQYVQQNMNRGTINLEDMAAAMGMSMKPLFQKVREITGKTPAEVVRDLRLKHACILLQRTNINMSELANHIGFATGEHFINIFKERFGMSPSEYRLKYRR